MDWEGIAAVNKYIDALPERRGMARTSTNPISCATLPASGLYLAEPADLPDPPAILEEWAAEVRSRPDRAFVNLSRLFAAVTVDSYTEVEMDPARLPAPIMRVVTQRMHCDMAEMTGRRLAVLLSISRAALAGAKRTAGDSPSVKWRTPVSTWLHVDGYMLDAYAWCVVSLTDGVKEDTARATVGESYGADKTDEQVVADYISMPVGMLRPRLMPAQNDLLAMMRAKAVKGGPADKGFANFSRIHRATETTYADQPEPGKALGAGQPAVGTCSMADTFPVKGWPEAELDFARDCIVTTDPARPGMDETVARESGSVRHRIGSIVLVQGDRLGDDGSKYGHCVVMAEIVSVGDHAGQVMYAVRVQHTDGPADLTTYLIRSDAVLKYPAMFSGSPEYGAGELTITIGNADVMGASGGVAACTKAVDADPNMAGYLDRATESLFEGVPVDTFMGKPHDPDEMRAEYDLKSLKRVPPEKRRFAARYKPGTRVAFMWGCNRVVGRVVGYTGTVADGRRAYEIDAPALGGKIPVLPSNIIEEVVEDPD